MMPLFGWFVAAAVATVGVSITIATLVMGVRPDRRLAETDET